MSTPQNITPVVAERGPRWHRLPVISHLRQSVGLQRGMLIAGLVLSGIFLLTALFAPILAPYGFAQLRDAAGAFGARAQAVRQLAHLYYTTKDSSIHRNHDEKHQ